MAMTVFTGKKPKTTKDEKARVKKALDEARKKGKKHAKKD